MRRTALLALLLLPALGSAQIVVLGGIDNPPAYSQNTTCYPPSVALRPEGGKLRLGVECAPGERIECIARSVRIDSPTRTMRYECEALPVSSGDLELRVYPTFAQVAPGVAPRIDVLLKNTGAATLSSPGFAAAGIDCIGAWTSLSPGQTVSKRCTLPALTDDRTVLVEAVAGTQTVSASARYWVNKPRLSVAVTPVVQLVRRGERPAITIIAMSLGSTTVQEVDLATRTTGLCAQRLPAPLAPGQSGSLSCQLPPAEADYQDFAQAAGQDLSGVSALAESPFRVSVSNEQGAHVFTNGFE